MTAVPDKKKSIMQIAKDYGYPIEQHFYETEDGYINRVFRISGPRGTTPQNNAAFGKKKPVIIY